MEPTNGPTVNSDGRDAANSSAIELSIVIVSYNCRDLILACLRSVEAAKPLAAGVEVIIVDNASADGSLEAIGEAFPDLRLIALKENIGFGRGCNVGVAEAQGALILLLNPDTVLRPQTLERALKFSDDRPSAGIWGGRMITDDGRPVTGACWRFPTLWSTFCVTSGISRVFPNSDLFNRESYGGWRPDEIRDVEVVSGCFLLIRMELWYLLGGFDPTYFLYSEEVDLCLRARRLGARPVITPDVEFVHDYGGTQPVRADRLIRLLTGKRTYMLKHWSWLAQWIGGFLLILWPLSRYAFLGIPDALSNRPGKGAAASTWGEVWRRRREWYPGYPRRGLRPLASVSHAPLPTRKMNRQKSASQ